MRWVLVGLAVTAVLGCTDARDEFYTEKAFFTAASRGNLTVVKLFVEAGMSVNTVATIDSLRIPALQAAAVNGHLSVVRYLVEQGADVNATDT